VGEAHVIAVLGTNGSSIPSKEGVRSHTNFFTTVKRMEIEVLEFLETDGHVDVSILDAIDLIRNSFYRTIFNPISGIQQ
jgi:hypothetical protein